MKVARTNVRGVEEAVKAGRRCAFDERGAGSLVKCMSRNDESGRVRGALPPSARHLSAWKVLTLHALGLSMYDGSRPMAGRYAMKRARA